MGFHTRLKKASVLLLCLGLLAPLAYVSGVPPYLVSKWSPFPPTIDGQFGAGEWSNPQIVIQSPILTYAYFANDWENLYVMVDAMGDITDDAGDKCLLVFYSNGTRNEVCIIGASGTTDSDGFYAVVGFYGSPNNATNHKIYEWRFSLSMLNAEPCMAILFCSPTKEEVLGPISMPYDASDGRDNVWPPGLDYAVFDTWAQLKISCPPVGGEILPLNTVRLMIPYALMISTIIAAGLALRQRKRII